MAKAQLAELRVKVKSLAEEARIIRREERRAKGRRVAAVEEVAKDRLGRAFARRLSPGTFKYRDDATRMSLFWHRMGLRVEQRATLLAYAFLRGRDYRVVERPANPVAGNEKLMERVCQIVKKFGPMGGIRTKGSLEVMVSKWVCGGLVDNPFKREPKAVLVG